MEHEAVFKALADPNRRLLLDLLFEKDGRSLGDLCSNLEMSRNGCTKHLAILEEANLITIEWSGRKKHHYLNPVPIQQVYDRWVSKYAQPWAQTLTQLKSSLEAAMDHKHIQQIFIRTTPERLWQALTDGELTRLYYFGSAIEGEIEAGGAYRYPNPAGGSFIEGEIVECEPPHRLVMTFNPVWLEGTRPTSRVTWLIEPEGGVCRLKLIHEGLDPADANTQDIIEGWARITSGLKTLLETGEPMMEGPVS